MSQQTYPVKCACGVVHQCPAGYAGSRFACQCGKAVEVPGLSVLRTMVPLDGDAPPEAEFDARSRLGQLPVEDECVLCRAATDGVVSLTVECERPQARQFPPLAIVLMVFVFCLFGWLGLLCSLFLSRRVIPGQMFGDYLSYELPVRACGRCSGELLDPVRANEAVRAPSLYARLLGKYPSAYVVRCSVDPSRQLPNPFRWRRTRQALVWFVGMIVGLIFFLSTMVLADRIVRPRWDSGGRAGEWFTLAAVTVAIGGAVLVGFGVGRIVGKVHRHFSPDRQREE